MKSSMKISSFSSINETGSRWVISSLAVICLLILGHTIHLSAQTGNIEKLQNVRIKTWKNNLETFKPPGNAIKLKHLYSIPGSETGELETDSPVYLKAASHLCSDRHGNIYVSDSQNHRVYKFAANGRILNHFGTRGKGPGDLLNPQMLSCDREDNLVLLDSSNFRIQIYTPDGSYRHSFRLFETYSFVALDRLRQLIYCSPAGYDMKKPLVRVFDYKGKIKHSFGERKAFSKNILNLNTVHMDVNSKGEIYIAWRFFPLVRKYSPAGKLLGQFRPGHRLMLEEEKSNYKEIKSNRSRREFQILIAGIRSKKDGFYLFRYNPRMEILEFDDDGTLTHHFWADQSYNLVAGDFIVKERDGFGMDNKDNKNETHIRKLIYILKRFPENEISVYAISGE